RHRTSPALLRAGSALLTVRVRKALSPPRAGAVTTRRPRSAAAIPAPSLRAAPPTFTVHPAGIPDRVALSVSSPSPVALSPLSVIGPSSLACPAVAAAQPISYATPLAVTLRTSTALVPAPSAALTARVRRALSPHSSE